MFDCYHAWLDLEPGLENPDYYQLFRLARDEGDEDRIHRAADRAIAQVRGFRPGAQAKQWAELLDTLRQGKKTLLDPVARKQYDASLTTLAQDAPVVSHKPPELAAVNRNPNLFPPGMAPEPAPDKPAAATTQRAASSVQPSSPVKADKSDAASSPVAAKGTDPMAAYAPTASVPVARLAADPMAPLASSPHPTTSAPTAPHPATPPASTPSAAGWPSSGPAADPMQPAAGYSVPTGPAQPAVETVHRPPVPKKSQLPVFLGVVGVMLLLTVTVLMVALRGNGFSFGSSKQTVDSGDSPSPSAAGDSNLANSNDSGDDPARPTQAPTNNNTLQSAADDGNVLTPGAAPLDDNDTVNALDPAPGQAAADTTTNNGTTTNQGTAADNENGGGDTTSDTNPSPPPAVDPTNPSPGTPDTSPPPTPPPSDAPATPEELRQLGEALTTAKIALGERNFPLAEQLLTQATGLAKSAEHQAMVERLQLLSEHVQAFWKALGTAVENMQAGVDFQVGSTVCVVVDKGDDWITVRYLGMNQRFNFRDLKPGLAVAIVETYLDPNAAETRVLKGAYVAALKDASPIDLEKARTWWMEAELGGADISMLVPVLDDQYDLAP